MCLCPLRNQRARCRPALTCHHAQALQPLDGSANAQAHVERAAAGGAGRQRQGRQEERRRLLQVERRVDRLAWGEAPVRRQHGSGGSAVFAGRACESTRARSPQQHTCHVGRGHVLAPQQRVVQTHRAVAARKKMDAMRAEEEARGGESAPSAPPPQLCCPRGEVSLRHPARGRAWRSPLTGSSSPCPAAPPRTQPAQRPRRSRSATARPGSWCW